MSTRTTSTALICLAAVFAGGPATAQQDPADVTFNVPVNLTRLPSALTKIKVTCELHSNAIIQHPASVLPAYRRDAQSEVPIVQGEVAETVQVVIPLTSRDLDNPSGKQAFYNCLLFAYRQSDNFWQNLTTATSLSAPFILTPQPQRITGSFVW
ncbi:MAG: hypothetical protein ACREVI_05945 [Steroidobacteraceae bacterium]